MGEPSGSAVVDIFEEIQVDDQVVIRQSRKFPTDEVIVKFLCGPYDRP